MTKDEIAKLPTPETDAHDTRAGTHKLLYMTQHARSLEQRLAAAVNALDHIVWIKDGGIDGRDERGVFRNFPESERDSMYLIARETLAAIRGDE